MFQNLSRLAICRALSEHLLVALLYLHKGLSMQYSIARDLHFELSSLEGWEEFDHKRIIQLPPGSDRMGSQRLEPCKHFSVQRELENL